MQLKSRKKFKNSSMVKQQSTNYLSNVTVSGWENHRRVRGICALIKFNPSMMCGPGRPQTLLKQSWVAPDNTYLEQQHIVIELPNPVSSYTNQFNLALNPGSFFSPKFSLLVQRNQANSAQGIIEQIKCDNERI